MGSDTGSGHPASAKHFWQILAARGSIHQNPISDRTAPNRLSAITSFAWSASLVPYGSLISESTTTHALAFVLRIGGRSQT